MVKRKSFRIEEDLYSRMEQFVDSMAGKYSKSEVLATAIYMYHDMFGDNPKVPDNLVYEVFLEKDKIKSKAAMWAFKIAPEGKVQKGIIICAAGVEIKMPKNTAITYKPPNIIEFSLFKGCHSQLIIDEGKCVFDEKDNIYFL